MIKLYIDGDLILYRASAAVQREYKWSPDCVTTSADFPDAKRILDKQVRDFRRALDAEAFLICLTDPVTENNWRRQVLPTYKHQRVKVKKPVLLRELREYAEANYPCTWKPGLEADDLMGIAATAPESDHKRIVVSWDKDLKGVPCNLWNPQHADHGVVEVTPAEADRFHLMQTLTGDQVDGYTGIPGVGPKKAARILDSVDRIRPSFAPRNREERDMYLWSAVTVAYEVAGLTEQDALTQARVARILRFGEWDAEIGVKLWTPTSST